MGSFGQCRESPLISRHGGPSTLVKARSMHAHMFLIRSRTRFSSWFCGSRIDHPWLYQTCSPTPSGGVSARGSRRRGSGVENGVKTKQGLPPGAAADVSAQPNGSIGRTTQREGRSSTRATRSSLVAFCGLEGGHPLQARDIASIHPLHIRGPTES